MKSASRLLILAAGLALSACGDSEPTKEPSQQIQSAEPSTPASRPPDNLLYGDANEITTSSMRPRQPLTPEQQSQVVNLMMNRLAERQSQGLGDGHIVVNGAWNYDGYSTLSPNPEAAIPARMVAVDLTVSGHTPEFDPDDIEIVDGITSISYGSDPHLTLISGPGEIITDPAKVPVAPAPTRMLLIYAFPKDTKTFTLYYWGQKLLAEPRTFEPEGWGLPFPDTAAPAAP